MILYDDTLCWFRAMSMLSLVSRFRLWGQVIEFIRVVRQIKAMRNVILVPLCNQLYVASDNAIIFVPDEDN